MSAIHRTRSGKVELLAAFKAVADRLAERPTKNYIRRAAMLGCWNECEAGGEPVVEFELDHRDLQEIIKALGG